MRRVYGMKAAVLTRGGLTETAGVRRIKANPASDDRLNRQESAEAIVPEQS